MRNIQLTAEHAETAEVKNTISQRTLSTLRSRLLRRTGALSGEIFLRVWEWVNGKRKIGSIDFSQGDIVYLSFKN